MKAIASLAYGNRLTRDHVVDNKEQENAKTFVKPYPNLALSTHHQFPNQNLL